MSTTTALIDIGGSSVKVSIRDSRTSVLHSYEVETTPLVDGKHIFLRPDELFTKVIEAMNLCALKLSEGTQIESIYISTLRQGFCLISRNRELTPLYLNSDTSGDNAKSDIERYGSDRIYNETGHWFAPQLTLPKLINLFRVSPELRVENPTLLFVHDWLAWKFTGELVTEMTLVSAGQMADIANKEINFELLGNFDIPLDLLPKPKSFGETISHVQRDLREKLSPHWSLAKVCTGGGDSHFLHMGASGNKSGKVVVSAGSSTPISLLHQTLGSSSALKPWKSTAFVKDAYLLEGNLGYPGSFYGWLSKNTEDAFLDDVLNIKNLSKAPTVFGSCNMWNEAKWESRPAFSIMGDFSGSSSTDLALGLTLDYGFSLANQLFELKKDNYFMDEIILTGGGANSKLQAILSCLIDVPVRFLDTQNSIKNLFDQLEGQISGVKLQDFDAEILDSESREYLVDRARSHSLLYSEFEGTRRVLENAR